MKKYYIYIISITMMFLFSNCASNGESIEDSNINDDINTETLNQENSTLEDINPSDPFYPLKQSIFDLENEINDLKSKVIEYELKLHHPSFDYELLELIKMPQLKHELIMTNGTIIQGTIIAENADAVIVQTQIGQLTIEKALITEIKEIDPLTPKIEFVEDEIEERKNEEKYTYVGKVKNTGGLRADFIRVVYHFWQDDTSPILTDSTYISGNSIFYSNGVISDASLNPAEFGIFTLTINIPDSLNVEYHTKEVKWDTFK